MIQGEGELPAEILCVDRNSDVVAFSSMDNIVKFASLAKYAVVFWQHHFHRIVVQIEPVSSALFLLVGVVYNERTPGLKLTCSRRTA